MSNINIKHTFYSHLVSRNKYITIKLQMQNQNLILQKKHKVKGYKENYQSLINNSKAIIYNLGTKTYKLKQTL